MDEEEWNRDGESPEQKVSAGAGRDEHKCV